MSELRIGDQSPKDDSQRRIREVIRSVPFKRVNYPENAYFTLHDLHLVVAGFVVDVFLAPVRKEHVQLSMFRNKVQIPIELQVETLPERFQGDLKQETNKPMHLNQSEAGV